MGRRMDWCGNSKRGEALLGDRFAPRARTGLWQGQAGAVLPARVRPPGLRPPALRGPAALHVRGAPLMSRPPGPLVPQAWVCSEPAF